MKGGGRGKEKSLTSETLLILSLYLKYIPLILVIADTTCQLLDMAGHGFPFNCMKT